MANSFANNTKVQLVAGAVADNCDYLKASVSKMSQGDFKGKKYGKSYKLYIPDVGTVSEGLVAHPDEITEVETEILLNNFNTSVTINAWNELGDIEDFAREIAKPRGVHLARSMQQALVKANCFKSAQAVVAASAGFGVLSDAAAKLNELAVAGDIVSFMHPTVMGTIAATGLANFISSQEAKDIYSRNYLGDYAGASQINMPLLPVITVGVSAATAAVTFVKDTNTDGVDLGFQTVDTVTGTNLFVGAMFTLSDLKVVDQSGIETDQDYAVIVTEVNNAGTSGKITPLRVTFPGMGHNNPNAWMPASTSAGSTSLKFGLSTSTSYYVGQVRSKESFAFDTYKFENLPGSENEQVATVGGVTVKMSMYGDGETLEKLVRLDVPHAGGIWDNRGSVTVYIVKS